jgi:enoyl-CoA hydratase/carnithine racemase
MKPMSADIAVEKHGPIATVTLTRAHRGNALTRAMLAELESVARGFAADEETRAVIFRADGENFSYGADLDEMGGSGGQRPSTLMLRRGAELGGKMMSAVQDIHQPTVCAVQGVATGGATCLATACDFRIASEEASLGYGEVKLGINLMWTALPTCVHLVGPARAKQMIMTGRLFDAATLADWGLIDETCPRAELDERAIAWAQGYAALPPIAVQMIKRSINRVVGALDAAIMHADVDQWVLGTRTEDFREAISAFQDKREPEFRGD